MALNLDSRLERLRDRRRGLSTLRKAMDSAYSSHSAMVESYETRSGQKAVRYTLGAMQAVERAYTQNSIAEGDRVKSQIEKGLSGIIKVKFDYQGSVPLDVHIRGISDIDLLVLRAGFITIDPHGSKANTYGSWQGPTPVALLTELRTRSAAILKDAFPEVTVNTSGSKSIALDGGSLRRKVDVVPSHWHDSADYQLSGLKKDRAVQILVHGENRTIRNLPFRHIHLIEQKNVATTHGVKKVIRLLKTLRNDSDHSVSIKLSSYDIAGLVWHFANADLTVPISRELTLLAVAQQRIKMMMLDKQGTMRLMTPDGSRAIVDSKEKFTGLHLLSLELDQLSEEVAKEVVPYYNLTGGMETARQRLKESVIL